MKSTVLSQTQYHLGLLLKQRQDWQEIKLDYNLLYQLAPPSQYELRDYLAVKYIEEMTGKRTLSYSQIINWQRCRQRWFYTYIEDLTPKLKTVPLMTGDVTHRLREKFLIDELDGEVMRNLIPYVKKLYPEEDPDVLTDVALESAGLVNTYVQEYESDGTVKIVSPEVHLVKDFGEFNLYARIDGLAKVKDVDGLWREELKTTSRKDSAYLKGLRRGLQTGIALWLMEELMDEPVRGTVFSLLVKTKTPQVYITPVYKAPKFIEMAKETVFNEARAIKGGEIWRSSDCFQYNRECSFTKLCTNDTPENREAFFTSRSEQKARGKEIQ